MGPKKKKDFSKFRSNCIIIYIFFVICARAFKFWIQVTTISTQDVKGSFVKNEHYTLSWVRSTAHKKVPTSNNRLIDKLLWYGKLLAK